jgi:hypothetical protein
MLRVWSVIALHHVKRPPTRKLIAITDQALLATTLVAACELEPQRPVRLGQARDAFARVTSKATGGAKPSSASDTFRRPSG